MSYLGSILIQSQANGSLDIQFDTRIFEGKKVKGSQFFKTLKSYQTQNEKFTVLFFRALFCMDPKSGL